MTRNDKTAIPTHSIASTQNTQGHPYDVSLHLPQRMMFDDLHANCDNRAEKIAPNTKPVGPHAPNAENTILRFKPTGKVVPTSAIAFGTKIAGPIP